MKNIKIIILLIFVSGIISCEDFSSDLDVENVENPNGNQLGTEATAKKIFQNWYVRVNYSLNASGKGDAPGMALSTMADASSCSWGNGAMKDMSSEPRVAWDNQPAYEESTTTSAYFNSLYSILSDSNVLLSSIDNGVVFSEPEKIKSVAYMGQALSIGYLALIFDKVWLSDETGVLNEGEPVDYKEAMVFALQKMDLAISEANNGSFTIDSDYINGVNMSSAEFSKLLNSLAARMMVNNVRNSTQRDALDWEKVLSYADNGITSDFKVTGDGWNNWVNEHVLFMFFPGWGRVDMRVVHLMDPNTIDYWTSSNPTIPPSTSNDARLATDFQYLSSQSFRPSRGLYHYSSYRHSRYDWYIANSYTGEYPEMLKTENDMYKAEAQLRTNDLIGAASTVNTSSRVTRGNLPPVSANADEIYEAIHYERSVELLNTAMGLQFFEMRKENLLQKGTPLQFPVPGRALQAAKLPTYTFGGTTGVPGEDYSNGGWR